jgi:hypothetical protein
MKQIDEQGYKDGGAAFHKGKTLRSLFEARFAAMSPAKEGEQKDWDKVQDYQKSFEIGFADALLAKFRIR